MILRVLLFRLALVAVLIASAVFPAAAQERLFALTSNSTITELDTTPARFGAVLHTWAIPTDPFPLPPGTGLGLPIAPVMGGRYLAWARTFGEGVFQVRALDTVTGAVLSANLGQNVLNVGLLGANSEGDELVLRSSSPAGDVINITVLNLRTGAARVHPIPAGCVAMYTLAPEAGLLMIMRVSPCLFGPVEQWIDILDLADGSVRERVVDVPWTSAERIATNADGTRLWVGRPALGHEPPPGVVVFDTATGEALATNTDAVPRLPGLGIAEGPTLTVNSQTNVVFVVTSSGLVGLDGDTLEVLMTADAPMYREAPLEPGFVPILDFQVFAHPASSAIHVYESSASRNLGLPLPGVRCHQAALIALDPSSGERLITLDTEAALGTPTCHVRLAMAFAPVRPANLRAEVSGRRVTLSWDRPAQTVRYELEAGSAPGLSDLALLSTDTVPLVVQNVPPGTYHVRVRAVNYAGKGLPTDDIVVVVE